MTRVILGSCFCFAIPGVLFAAYGCSRPASSAAEAAPVVYCSVDESFARNVLHRYRERTGVEPAVVFDTEAGKTTGLVNKIISEAEAGRPRADVFWSSELFNTIVLARRGLLEAYGSPSANDIPDRFRDRERRWTALAARARVLAFDPARVSREDVPFHWESLANRKSAERVAMAHPLFGTTRGHVAAMFVLWGPQRAKAFLTSLRDADVQLVDGNSASVRAVVDGRASLAATDSDDVWVAQKSGARVDLAYPDMGEGGTLLIPCSVAIVKGAPHPAAARRLVDYLVSAEVERMLAQSESRNIPVRAALRAELGIPWPPESQIDYEAVADAMPEAVQAVREILLR